MKTRYQGLIVKNSDPLVSRYMYVDAATIDEALDLVCDNRPDDYRVCWVQPA